ncbi:hypothetical protein B4Q13_22265, partial [Lacticaseibacillus rhamnosus]
QLLDHAPLLPLLPRVTCELVGDRGERLRRHVPKDSHAPEGDRDGEELCPCPSGRRVEAGEGRRDRRPVEGLVPALVEEMATIAGQKPVVTRSRVGLVASAGLPWG